MSVRSISEALFEASLLESLHQRVHYCGGLRPEPIDDEEDEEDDFLPAQDADWQESQHPRGKGGQFAPAGSLYAPHAETAPKTDEGRVAKGHEIAKAVGAHEKVAQARTKIATATPTVASVKDGGHVMENGEYTPQRKALHRKLLDELFTPDAVERATPKEGERPTMTLLGGRGGSGKSWLTSEEGPAPKNSITIDADHFKSRLPEYEGWNAAMLHEESSDLVEQAAKVALENKLNVTFDATLKSSNVAAQRVADFKQAGHEIHGYYMFASPETATRRAMGRFVRGGEKGRFVPPEIIMANTQNESNFDELIPQFKKWGVYDNDRDDGSPHHVASGENHGA